MSPTLLRLAADALAVALLLAAGISITALVPELRRKGWVERLGWSWLLGAAWLGLAAFAASFVLHAPLRPRLFAILAALPAAAALLARPFRPARPASARARPAPWPLVAVAVGTLTTVALLSEAIAVPPHDFDGRMTWGAQARFIADAGSVLPEALTHAEWWVELPRYPLLLPLLQTLPMQIAGDLTDGRIPRPLYPLFLPALALALYGAAKPFAGRRAAAMATLLLFLTPAVMFEDHGGARGMYSDLPLAALLAGGLFLLLRARGGAASGAAAGLLLAAAALTKSEGLPLAFAALAGGAAVSLLRGRRRRSVVRLASAAGPLLAAALLLAAWRSHVPDRNSVDYAAALASHPPVARLLASGGAALRVAAGHLGSWREWGLAWSALGILFLATRRWRRPLALACFLVVAVEAALMLLAWSLVPNGGALAEVTVSRAAIPVLALVLLPAALAIREAFGPRSRAEVGAVSAR